VEYARAVSARTRLEVALEMSRQARSEVSVTIGETHDVTHKIDDCVTGMQIALAKLNIAIPRIP
jgi:hypothetical protein